MAELPNISPFAERLVAPLDQFLDELVSAGFARDRVGIPLRLRLMDLFNFLPSDATPEQLKYKLSALICQSAVEQTKFYGIFDTFIARFQWQPDVPFPEIPNDPTKVAPVPPPPPVTPTQRPPLSTKQDDNTGRHKTDTIKAARSGPITVELHFRDDGYRPWSLPELEAVVRPLREKEPSGAEEWDIPQSIRQTIRAGGAPQFARRRRRSAPQYLFLIEQKSTRDHLAGFYADLVSELSRRDLDAEFYFYDGVPRQCWKDRRDPATITTIEQLNASFAMSRLILIGEPDGLLAVTNEPKGKKGQPAPTILLYPAPLAFQLRDEWSAVALLNTRSTALWGEVETAMHRLFPIAPATAVGLGSLLEQWKNRISYQPMYWKMAHPEPIPPVFQPGDDRPETIQEKLRTLRGYLGKQGYTWLCAIAVYPEIYWQLTKILHDEAISKADVPDESLRTQLWHLFLLRMSRLEWLRRGHIPPEYRHELRKALPDANAVEVRRQLLEVLELHENTAPENSYANKDQRYTIALLQHERYVAQEKPDAVRLAALEEKFRLDVENNGVHPSDIEDAVGRRLYRRLPEKPVETLRNFWVLWVDDDPDNNISFQESLSKETRIRFVNVTNTQDALKALPTQQFDLVVSDVSRFDDKEAGVKMMRRFQAAGVTTPTLFFTHPNYVRQHKELLVGMGALDAITGFDQLRPRLLEAAGKKAVEHIDIEEWNEQANQASRAVCRVATEGISGTGFLISGGYLITCHHILPSVELTTKATIQLGEGSSAVTYRVDPSVDFVTHVDLDFTRVKIVDDPSRPLSQWGFLTLETSIPEKGSRLAMLMLQFESETGPRRMIDAFDAEDRSDTLLYYYAQTMPGRSGAPVFNSNWRVVAMHHAVKERAELQSRSSGEGVLISPILSYLADLDSNKNKNAPDPNEAIVQQADERFEKGREAGKNKDYESAQEHLRVALELYTQAKHRAGQANVHQEFGRLYMEMGRLEEAKQRFITALTAYTELDYTAAQAFLLMDLGKLESALGDIDQSQKNYLEALELLEGINSDMDDEMLEVLSGLANNEINRVKYEDALEYLKEGLEKARKAQKTDWQYNLLHQQGAIYLRQNLGDQALSAFRSALEVAPNDLERARCHEQIAEAYLLENQPAQAISNLNEAWAIYAKASATDAQARVTRKIQEVAAMQQSNAGPKVQSRQNAPPEPDASLQDDKIQFFILCDAADRVHCDGLTRHLIRTNQGDNITVTNVLNPPDDVDIAQWTRYKIEQSNYILVLPSVQLLTSPDWFGFTFDALQISGKIIPVLIRSIDLNGSGLEKLETLPRGSRNKTIAQFEDPEDAYYVIAQNIGEMLAPTTGAEPPASEEPPMESRFVPDTTRLFILTAPEDANRYNELNRHLTVLKRTGKISIYSYFEVIAGEEWQPRLRFEIQQADLILPLVSVNLINSEFDFGLLQDALKAGRRVAPILIGRVDLDGTGLEKLRFLPTGGRAVSDFPNQDEAWTDVVREIRRLLPEGEKVAKQPTTETVVTVDKQQVRDLISRAKLRDALDLLQKAAPDSPDVISLKAQLADLEKNERLGVIDFKDVSLRRNQITMGVLNLLNSMPEEANSATQKKEAVQTKTPPIQKRTKK